MGRTGVCEECPRLGQGSLVGSRAEGQDPVRAVGGPTAPIPKAETGEAGLEKALHKDPEAGTLTLHSSLDGPNVMGPRKGSLVRAGLVAAQVWEGQLGRTRGLTSALPPTGLTALFTVACSRPLSKRRLGCLEGHSLGQWICDHLIFFFSPVNF